MRSATFLALGLSLTACGGLERDRTPAEAYRNWKDRLIVAAGLPAVGIAWPCGSESKVDGVKVFMPLSTDRCFRMTEPKRWRGVWVDEFEGSRFCPGERLECPYRRASSIWFSPDLRETGKPHGDDRFFVDFVGRRTLYAGSYGHMGGYEHEIVMDRLISIRRLKRPKD